MATTESIGSIETAPAKAGTGKSVSVKTESASATKRKEAGRRAAQQGAAKAARTSTAKKTAKAAVGSGKAKTTKAVKKAAPKAKKVSAAKKGQKTNKSNATEKARLLASKVVYEGPLFRVLRDRIIEPGGRRGERDVIRHNGSAVILALDPSKSKKDPWVVMERQYRHAANQFLWELPAGTLDPDEDPLEGAKRELAEETGYSARKWKPFVEYYASPGFLGESMKVFIAEGLVAGEARPEDDEQIEFRLIRLSEIVKMIGKGAILDGKTLCTVLLYASKLAGKKKK